MTRTRREGPHPIAIRTHGTGGYARGCRCATCKAAYRAYHNNWRRTDDERHGVSRTLREHYGLTLDQVNAMIAGQDRRCGICREPLVPYKGGTGGKTHVDHDHRSGSRPNARTVVLRGILCHLCNQALGKFRDDPANLDAAARYVRAGGLVYEPGLAGGLIG